jgi:hypothetical protein
VVHEPGPEALRLVLVPRVGGLLAGSLALVAAGLGLFALRSRPKLAGGLAVGLALAIGAAAFAWPQPAAQALAAAQPGLAVLGLGLGAYWLVQRRYRRKVEFLPAFTRVKAGSSLTQSSSRRPQPREPSTIDAPPPAAGSDPAWAVGGSGT